MPLSLLCVFFHPASSWHSLKYLHVATMDAGEDLPSLIAMAYLDDQLFATYSSKTKQYKPHLPWAEKNLSAKYWDGQSRIGRGNEKLYRVDLVTLRNRYNQTGGFHMLQYMAGCEVSPEGQKRGYFQFAYDGRDFISFDLETLTWLAGSAEAQVTKQKLAADYTLSQNRKFYLQNVCVGWLRKFLTYAEEKIPRTETPVVTLARKASFDDDLKTLICRADGFYPKDIVALWTKDGQVWEQETLHGVVAPNSDGTYHTWISITINPKEQNHFQCHVHHVSLAKPINIAVDEPGKDMTVMWVLVVPMLAVIITIGVAAFFRIRQKEPAYKATALRCQNSDSFTLPQNSLVCTQKRVEEDPLKAC
uniref:Ig-like domain-containing protein n=1 Tax=Salvator merianae TaxID=96440 RepID=A0A8D0AYV2_SALMN